MKAAILDHIKEISIKEIAKPEIIAGEALIRVKYAGVCGSDIHAFLGELSTAEIPLIPGHEFCGELVDFLPGIELDVPIDFKICDLVTAHPTINCGVCESCLGGRDNLCPKLKIFGVNSPGAFAEYIKVPLRKVYRLSLDFEPKLGALVEPLAVAIHDIKRSNLSLGQTVLIIGAGPIGILIGIVAKQCGAKEIVLTEISDYREKFANELGFIVVNPRKTDLEREIAKYNSGKGFDLVFEVSGSTSGISLIPKVAKNGGTVILVGMPKDALPMDIMKCEIKELDVKGCRIHPQVDFATAVKLLNRGYFNDLISKLVTRVFPLKNIKEAYNFALESDEYMKILIEI
jgi:2-desacetyl-2-hydroxyethyl bacteriochlorophyllide A dehydrogenase